MRRFCSRPHENFQIYFSAKVHAVNDAIGIRIPDTFKTYFHKNDVSSMNKMKDDLQTLVGHDSQVG